MDDGKVWKNLAKIFRELTDHANHVERCQNKNLAYVLKRPDHASPVPDHAHMTQNVTINTVHTHCVKRMGFLTPTLTTHRPGHFVGHVKKSHIRVDHRSAPTLGTRTAHHILRWLNRLSTMESERSTFQMCTSRSKSDSLTSSVYRHTVWSIRTNPYDKHFVKQTSKTENRMRVHMRPNSFNPADPIHGFNFSSMRQLLTAMEY